MIGPSEQKRLNGYARLAGFMYLFVIGVYILGDYVASSLHVRGDFAQTAANIAASETNYRLGLVLQLLASATTILLGGTLYAVLKPVHAEWALMALLWRVAETVVGGFAVISKFTAMNVYLGAAAGPAAGSEALVDIIRYGAGVSFPVSTAYFSLGSLVFFWLFLRSRFIPRWLAGLGLIASALVTGMSFATLVIPSQTSAWQFLWAPIFVAEVLAAFWLLLRGVDVRSWNKSSVDAAERRPAEGE